MEYRNPPALLPAVMVLAAPCELSRPRCGVAPLVQPCAPIWDSVLNQHRRLNGDLPLERDGGGYAHAGQLTSGLLFDTLATGIALGALENSLSIQEKAVTEANLNSLIGLYARR